MSRKFLNLSNLTKKAYNVTNSTSMFKNSSIGYNLHTNLEGPKYIDYISLIGNTETDRKIKLILMEHEFARLSERDVPNHISVSDMLELLDCKSIYSRIECFTDLFDSEQRQNKNKLKFRMERSSTDWEKNRDNIVSSTKLSNHISYGPIYNSLHNKVSFNTFYEHRLAQATQFGQPLVFDFGYDKFMDGKSSAKTAKLIGRAYINNRNHQEPFNFHFCNIGNKNSHPNTISDLRKQLNNMFGTNLMITESSESYLKVFQGKECVYLSPFAEESMDLFNHDAVYIIGAYTDPEEDARPITFFKAKEDGVHCLKLPVEKYSKFRMGVRRTQRLPFSTVVNILLEIKTSGDLRTISPLLPTSKYFSRNVLSDYWDADEDANLGRRYLIHSEEMKGFKRLLKHSRKKFGHRELN